MKIIKDIKDIKAYKLYTKDGKWSVILALDEYSASELFKNDNNVNENDIDKIETLELSEKIPNVYNGKTETLEKMSKGIKFFPRCVLEIDDLSDIMEQRNSGVE